MIKVCLLVSALCTTVWGLKFENCATNPLTTAFHWLQFDMGPLPVIFPGQLIMSVNIQILQNLTKPLMETELYRADSSGGNAVQYPYLGMNIGTRKNIDLCTTIDRMNNRSDTDTQSLQDQIEEILLAPLGSHLQCPILATHYTEKHSTISLKPLAPAQHKILSGHYMMQISVKDDAVSTDNKGCIRFNFTIADGPPTPPTPPTPPPTTTLSGPLPPNYSEVIPFDNTVNYSESVKPPTLTSTILEEERMDVDEEPENTSFFDVTRDNQSIPPDEQESFQASVWQAVRKILPDVTMKGCAFHFGQAFYRKITDLGLTVAYERRDDVHKILRKSFALCLLPAADIEQALQGLMEKNKSPLVATFLQYIKRG